MDSKLLNHHSVYSGVRQVIQPIFHVKGLTLDRPQQMDGLTLLKQIDPNALPLVFFDPQYRSVLAKQKYGNEKQGKGKRRSALPQMSDNLINTFVKEISRALMPSGHLMLWVDKFLLCSGGLAALIEGSELKVVDMITWDKSKIGMGYRSRRRSEHLVVYQKPPTRAKGVWCVHNIPDVWCEKIGSQLRSTHPHAKPVELQKALITAVTRPGDTVVDPCAGSYSVLTSALLVERHFLGCDIEG